MKLATSAQLRAMHEAEIWRDLVSLLGEVYELDAPEVPEVPKWDPPETDDFTVAMGPDPAKWEDVGAASEAAYYEKRYHDALALVAKYAELAEDLHTKLEEISLDDHANVLADLSSRAKRLREDLGE